MKKYVAIDPTRGYPVGESMFYECTKCGTVLPSKPVENVACKCGNIVIDVEWGRIAVNDHSQFKVFTTTTADNGGKTN